MLYISGLVNYYQFEESSVLRFADIVSKDDFIDGDISTLIPQSEGKIGYGIENTGNKYLLMTNATSPFTDKISINFWYKRHSGGGGGNRTIVDWGANILNAGFGVWVNGSGYMGIRVNGENAAYRTQWFAPLDTWVMVTVTYDNTTVKMYLNGSMVYSYAKTKLPNPSDQRYLFRRRNYSEYTIANVDELSIWNEILSDQRIQEMANEDPQNPGTYLGKTLLVAL